MAIDMSKIRAKLGQLQGNNRRRDMMWRPEEGQEASVRIVAWPDNEGQPFKERWFYYNIGNNPGLLQPHQFGNPDPIQELINKLRDDGSPESYEMAKKLYPKMRTYALVLVRGEEEKGVRIWAFGKMVYQSLLNIMLDEDYGDITDFKDGTDVKVNCYKPTGRQYAITDVTPRRKSSVIHDDSKKVKDWLDNIPNLDDIYTCKTYEELEKIVNDWLDPGDDSSRERTHNESRSSSNSGSGDSSSKFKSLDDAFDSLKDL